jgi:thiol-disulfide isomerase/thioredoxin
MRLRYALGWLLLVLVGSGCVGNKGRTGLTSTGGGGSNGTNTPVDPFTLSSRDGVLAGFAMDRWRTPLADATIEILDLNEPRPAAGRAGIKTTSDRHGQYKFEGLNPAHQYQLVARTRDGSRTLVGTALGTPPNPRLPIFLTEDMTGADPRSASKDEEKGDTKTATQSREKTNAVAGPSATLAPPVKNQPEFDPTPAAPTPTNSLPATNPKGEPDRSRTTLGGFEREPVISIPAPTSPNIVPPPPTAPAPAPTPTPAITIPPAGPQANFGTPEGPSPELPTASTSTPSCLLVGRKLSNFALYDLDGQTWQYARDRDRRSRLVLLDFWYVGCDPCHKAIPILSGFQRHYGPHGLQVVGIACESGPRNEVSNRVRGVRARLGMNYTTLLSGGGDGPCPVVSQFEVSLFPTMVLLDEAGVIVWKKVGGFDEQSRAELDFLIRKKLSVRQP